MLIIVTFFIDEVMTMYSVNLVCCKQLFFISKAKYLHYYTSIYRDGRDEIVQIRTKKIICAKTSIFFVRCLWVV